MVLKSIELAGFKSFAKKTTLFFDSPVTGVVGPNGSGKSNIVEAIRFVLGEQSIKSLRGKGGTDLIFKGSKQLAPLNRASVTIVFDNTQKLFTFADSSDTKTKILGYDEVRITRVVYADGANSYLINDTEVRLKDIIELLSSVNIGSSGHHIISQGEADRILSANARDRRLMIEDALGLKIYQYRIKETERRLTKTEANMKEVNALKRELAPHLVYLKKQVEKIQKAESLRNDLVDLYRQYCGREQQIIAGMKHDLGAKRNDLNHAYQTMSEVFYKFEKEKSTPFVSLFEKEYLQCIHELSELGRFKNELERSLGRLEGAKGALLQPAPATVAEKKEQLIPYSYIHNIFSDIRMSLQVIGQSTDILFIHQTAKDAGVRLHDSLEYLREKEATPAPIDTSEHVEKINQEISEIEKQLLELETQRIALEVKKNDFEAKMGKERDDRAHQEKGYYEMLSQKASLEMEIKNLERDEQFVMHRESAFQDEIREGVVLLGMDMPKDFMDIDTHTETTVESQDELKRKIERVKIKLEESGGLGGSDTLKEFDTTLERDKFLTQELLDLDQSISELRRLIADLKVKLDTDFKEGIENINESFQKFFALMFGGGGAYLAISVEHRRKRKNEEEEDTEIPDITTNEDGDMEFERGIDIHVSLPQKKVKELGMLSGGERSLTSIALLFAMSQVNPPPFLVLDETDAALDEANSRRYGDMIENLARVSQLVVVTHNRETMSRAGILYGVTVGVDGASKLLSIKFDDATEYAK
jgi:chromosome segregation ATPase